MPDTTENLAERADAIVRQWDGSSRLELSDAILRLCLELSAELAEQVVATQKKRGTNDFEAMRLWNWWEAHLTYEHSLDCETGEVVIHRVIGNINDREWQEVARGDTLRCAIEAAMENEP